MRRIQEKIITKIKKNNLTLAQTAQKAGINIGTLKNIVYGKSNGSPKILTKIAEALNCSVEDFVASKNNSSLQEIFDSGVFSYCAAEFDKFYLKNNLQLSQQKSIDCIVNLCALCKKRKNKNLPFELNDEIIEWVIENL